MKMPPAFVVALCVLLSTLPTAATPCAAQSAAETDAQKRQSLLGDLRALDSESKELRAKLDEASAKAEIAAAAWTLDREWSKRLLRDALVLTFPEEVDRLKARTHAVGERLQFGSLEDRARGMVRSRVLKVAAADPAFAHELADVSARELGVVQEVEQYSQLASAAAGEGRTDDAAEMIRLAMRAEPTLIGAGFVINELAARDRFAADMLILEYINALRALPPSVFTGPGDAAVRVSFSFMMLLSPRDLPVGTTPPQPPGRAVARAYINFVMEMMSRAEQAHADVTRMHSMLTMLWPFVAENAPELVAQFNAMERASRPPGAGAPLLQSLGDMNKSGNKKYEERLKYAKETKDPTALEMAATGEMQRNNFDEARKLIDMLKDERMRAQLSEMADEKESLYLTNKGELAGAQKLARQLTRPDSMLRAYPPLIKRLAKNGDADSAQFLTFDAVQRLKTSAEKESANDTYVPSLLGSFAGAIRVFKQSRALVAMSELALAVETPGGGGDAALDVLDALAETANKARITSEQGNANFNAEAFAALAAKDEARVRAAASRLEDRLQRIVALASAYRGEAKALDASTKNTKR